MTRSCRAGSSRPTHPATDFPIQNLPFGRFRRAGTGEPWRIGVAIGDQVLDLKLASEQCPWPRAVQRAVRAVGRRRPERIPGARCRAAPCAARRAVARAVARQRAVAVPRPVPGAAIRGRADVAGHDRRLHRLLHRRSITPPRWASCSAPTTRCCPTTGGCRSATTAAARRSSPAARRSTVRADSCVQPMPLPPTRPTFAPSKRIDYELELGGDRRPGQRARRADRHRGRRRCDRSAWCC